MVPGQNLQCWILGARFLAVDEMRKVGFLGAGFLALGEFRKLRSGVLGSRL